MEHSFKLKLLRDDVALGSIPTLPDKAILGNPNIRKRALLDCINDVRVSYTLRVGLPESVPVAVLSDLQGNLLYAVMSDGIVYSL